LDRPEMQELGMGGLLGVAQGSVEPPKFIILRFRGAPQSENQGIALVGKGITFDTGGISLKPAERMHQMKGDMAGAAAVIGVMSGMFCNDEELSNEIIAAGQLAGEKFWPMPLDDEYKEAIQSDIADIKQTGGRYASAVTAAKILEQFVGDAQWAHLDIAGTDFIDTKKPYQEYGATGVAVRTLAEFVLRRAEECRSIRMRKVNNA